MNALMAREVSRATRGKLDPTELGFENAKAMKEFFDSAKTKEDEAKDESTKALEQAKTEAREQAKNEILAVANERLVAAEFKVFAAQHKVVSPNDALVIAKTLDLWKDITVEDDGAEVKITGFDDKFFEDLKSAKPFLFAAEAANGAAGSDGDAHAGSGTGGAGGGSNKDDALSPEALKKLYPHLPAAAG